MSSAFMPARFSTLRATSAGAVSMMQGSEPMEAKAFTRARLQAELPAFLLGAQQHRGGAIDDTRRIAGVMDMVDRLDLGIALDRHCIETISAEFREGRLQRRQGLHAGVWAHMFVAVEDGLAERVLDRDDRILEIALVPRVRGALLAFYGEGVDIVA